MDLAPTEQREAPAQWPTIIGVIAVIFGSLGALGGCMGSVMMPLMPKLNEMLSEVVPKGRSTGLEAFDEVGPWLSALSLVSILIALLLLVGGIGLLRRRPRSAGVCRTWAVVKMLFVVVNAYVGMIVQVRNFEAMQADPNMPMFSGFADIMGVMVFIFTLLWGWALPIFLLIWLARRSVRDEIATWRSDRL